MRLSLVETSSTISLQALKGSIAYNGLTIQDLATTTTSLAGKLGTGRGTILLNARNGNISLVGF